MPWRRLRSGSFGDADPDRNAGEKQPTQDVLEVCLRRPLACGLQRPQPSPATTVINVRRIHCVSAGLGTFCSTSEREDSRRGRL